MINPQAQRHKFVICLLLTLLLCVKPSIAKEVINYFYSDFPPFEYINKDNQAAGIGIDAVKDIFHNENLTFHYSSINRGLKFLKLGQYDFVSIISPSGKTREAFHISTRPIYRMALGIFRLKSSPAITSFEQLPQHTILTIESATYQSVTQQLPTNVLEKIRYNVGNVEEAIQLLSSNKFIYFLSYQYDEKLKQSHELTFDSLIKLPVYMALSKKHPKASELRALMNNNIAKLQ